MFREKGIEKVSKSVRTSVYLVFTSQIQVRWSIVDNSASALDAQQVLKSTFNALINKYSPNVLLLKGIAVYFSVPYQKKLETFILSNLLNIKP